MELGTIVNRYAEALHAIDGSTTLLNVNARTKEEYPPSLKTMREEQVVSAVDDWWGREYPEDFAPVANVHYVNYPYPNLDKATCDHVCTTDGHEGQPEWAIEVKKPELIGNNGKNNDFAVAKMLSPYLKDRGLLHDVLRLRAQGLGRRRAVLGYGFRYSIETCQKARELHPGAHAAIAAIEQVVRINDGELSLQPLISFCNGILNVRSLVVGGVHEAHFEAWRHPCGGEGLVFAWEISDAPGPKHPW